MMHFPASALKVFPLIFFPKKIYSKKFLYFLKKKDFLILCENGTLIFQETELSSPKFKKFREENF